MSPIKIKWVNTETGEEYQNDAVSLHFKPLNSIGEPIPGFSGKLLSEVPQWLSKVITENVSKPCQFTGLTDIHKNELFFDDAVSYCDVIYYLDWCKGEIILVPMEENQITEFALDLTESGVMSGRKVGNRWEPLSVLRQRGASGLIAT